MYCTIPSIWKSRIAKSSTVTDVQGRVGGSWGNAREYQCARPGCGDVAQRVHQDSKFHAIGVCSASQPKLPPQPPVRTPSPGAHCWGCSSSHQGGELGAEAQGPRTQERTEPLILSQRLLCFEDSRQDPAVRCGFHSSTAHLHTGQGVTQNPFLTLKVLPRRM